MISLFLETVYLIFLMCRLITDENPPGKIQNEINPALNTVKSEIKPIQEAVNVEDSAKVKVLPLFPPPIQIWYVRNY